MKKRIISVTGPTASGKTALAIALAKLLNGEIISCDSMQIYKGLEVGTAAPTPDEMDGIPHHGVGICEPTDRFSVAEWTQFAKTCIEDITNRGKLPIFCGGTGLYLDSLCNLDGFVDEKTDPLIREELSNIAREKGNQALHDMLQKIDPTAADTIHPNNVKRVIRAIEVFRTTGRTKTEIDAIQCIHEKLYDERRILLTFSDRQILYDRIDKRVDWMLDNGILEEARALWHWMHQHPDLPTGTAWQAIGFKEFFPYFSGESSLASCVDVLKQSSRRYAKRQITWFRQSDGYKLLADTADGTIRTTAALVNEILPFCTKE